MTEVLGFLAGFLGIELVATLIHRYLMHGPLWWIHRTHHKSRGGWELNDWFAVFFGLCGITLLAAGILDYVTIFWTFVGVGISAYGSVYFVLHDLMVHNRLPWAPKPASRYIRALRRAHRRHHRPTRAHPGESYGLLLFHPRYFSEERGGLRQNERPT